MAALTLNTTGIGPMAQPVTASGLPKRPHSSILNEAIPLFFIGRNTDGFWVVREADGPVGGIFLCKRFALRFVRINTEPGGYATMFLPEGLELDIENRGNRLAARLGAAKHLTQRLLTKLSAFLGQAATGSRRGHSNKNDDDLPIDHRNQM